MHNFFKLSKHGLPVNRAPDIVDLAADQISAHGRIGGVFKKMMRKELLVKSGGDLGKEDWVIVILELLISLGIPGMHGMTGLMGECINIRKNVRLVIHQDVRRVAITARRKCATSFPLAFITIAPAVPQTCSERFHIFIPEWFECCQDFLNGLVERGMNFEIRNQWHIGIVMMNLLEPKHPAAEFIITEKRIQIIMNG